MNYLFRSGCIFTLISFSTISNSAAFQGGYLGADLNYSNNNLDIVTSTPYINPNTVPQGFIYFDNPINAQRVSESGSGSFKVSQLMGGIFAGYNKLLAEHCLIGVEETFAWGESSHNTTNVTRYTDSTLRPQTSIMVKTKNLGTITGKLGFKNKNSLIYAKGGFATTELAFATNFTDGEGYASNNKIRYVPGWVVGIGAELNLRAGFTARAEVARAEFKNSSNISNNIQNIFYQSFPGTAFNSQLNSKMNLVRVGLVKYFNA